MEIIQRMKRVFGNKNVLLCGILPNFRMDDVDLEKYKEARGLFIEDPWERVKSIFSTDYMGVLHPELIYALDMTKFGFLTGALYGGVIESFKKTDTFIRTNDTNAYLSRSEMYKILSNENVKGFLKGTFKYAPKFALFTGGFSLISSCCEAYRNKYEILDGTIAGLVIGAVFKFPFGIKGMISGGIVGGVLGTIYGSVIWMTQKLTKTDNLQIKYAHFAYHRQRKNLSKNISQEPEINPETGLPKPRELDNFDVGQDEKNESK